MRLSRFAFLFLLAPLVSVFPVSSHAQFGISISVNFAPPVLPVYVQPVCPQPNLMWTPGYWAYSNDDGDYFWVPGAWVPAPYLGALWTPPYWGWNDGHYGFYDGYWGPTVGFYGGVNYGFGFGGVGFAGGEWRGGVFAYNTAVTQVDVTIIHTTYINQTIVGQWPTPTTSPITAVRAGFNIPLRPLSRQPPKSRTWPPPRSRPSTRQRPRQTKLRLPRPTVENRRPLQ